MLSYYYSLKRFVCTYLDYKWFKWAYQRMRYGFSARQLWSLDHTVTDFILPRLKAFRHGDGNSHTNGPSGCPMLPGYNPVDMTDEEGDAMYQEWLATHDKMILAFEYHKIDMDDVESGIDVSQFFKRDNKADVNKGVKTLRLSSPVHDAKWNAYNEEENRRNKIIDEGLMLFAKYYRNLWD